MMTIDLEEMERRASPYAMPGEQDYVDPEIQEIAHDIISLIARVRELENGIKAAYLRGHEDGAAATKNAAEQASVIAIDTAIAVTHKRCARIARSYGGGRAGEDIANAIERDAGSNTGTEK